MDTVILCIVGLLAGMLGGLLGIGGSILMIPAMTHFFGPQQHLYQAAAMIVNFFVVLPALWQHARAGAVMGGVVRRMAPLAVVAVVVGVVASESPLFRGGGQAYLMILFGVFLVYVGGRQLARMVRVGQQAQVEGEFDAKSGGWRAGLLAGLPTGFVAGLLGVGGGVICVPLQIRLLGMPLRNAIANSTATIVTLSCIGAFSKNYALEINHPEYTVAASLGFAAALIPTAIVGSLIGARLTHKLPLTVLRVVFVAVLIAAAARMIGGGVATLRSTGEAGAVGEARAAVVVAHPYG